MYPLMMSVRLYIMFVIRIESLAVVVVNEIQISNFEIPFGVSMLEIHSLKIKNNTNDKLLQKRPDSQF